MTTPPAADPKATPPAAGPAGEAARIASIDEKIAAVKDEIIGEVRKLLGGARDREQAHLTDPDESKTARAARAGQSLEQQIADAIKVNDDARAKDAADKAREDRLAKLEEAGKEKTPVDRRRVHRFMGWGEPPQ
jgi:hypothetical protein